MKKVLFIGFAFSIMLSLIGCHPKQGGPSLFKDAAMQDSLQRYFDRIDSIPNAFGAPSLFVVSFLLSDLDSMINLRAYSSLWKKVERENDTTDITTFQHSVEPNWIGLYRYGKKHILIEADWDPSAIINTPVLEPYEGFISQYQYDDPSKIPDCDLTFYWYNCEKAFLFKSPYSIIPQYRRIGKADPDYNNHPEYINY